MVQIFQTKNARTNGKFVDPAGRARVNDADKLTGIYHDDLAPFFSGNEASQKLFFADYR
jgi:hypothetical protein